MRTKSYGSSVAPTVGAATISAPLATGAPDAACSPAGQPLSSFDEPCQRLRSVTDGSWHHRVHLYLDQSGALRRQCLGDGMLQLSRAVHHHCPKAHRARDAGDVKSLSVLGCLQRLSVAALRLTEVVGNAVHVVVLDDPDNRDLAFHC